MRRVIDLEDAQRIVLEACRPAAAVDRRPRPTSLGRVLAADVVAAEDVPPFANSAVDGYAVQRRRPRDRARRADGRRRARRRRGAVRPASLGRGEAVRIMTGAPLPAGADAVAMVEDSERLDGGRGAARRRPLARRRRPCAAPATTSAPATSCFAAGTVVAPAVAGVLASVNARRPRRRTRRPGSPCCRPATSWSTDGSPLRPGQIRESNATMLAPLLAEAGCVVDHRGVVPDDEALLEAVLRDAASTCDAIVTSGGVSMGDYDVVKAVLGRIADMHWMQIGDQAGQAVRLRHASTASRCSACPATRSARSSASSCWPARRCGG